MPLRRGSVEYGHALEHLICQELKAYLSYNNFDKVLSYWHTSDNRYEVDFVIGDAEVAVEVKSSTEVSPKACKGLLAFCEEHPQAKAIIVSLEARPRLHNGIMILPAKDFLKRLWEGKIISHP